MHHAIPQEKKETKKVTKTNYKQQRTPPPPTHPRVMSLRGKGTTEIGDDGESSSSKCS